MTLNEKPSATLICHSIPLRIHLVYVVEVRDNDTGLLRQMRQVVKVVIGLVSSTFWSNWRRKYGRCTYNVPPLRFDVHRMHACAPSHEGEPCVVGGFQSLSVDNASRSREIFLTPTPYTSVSPFLRVMMGMRNQSQEISAANHVSERWMSRWK